MKGLLHSILAFLIIFTSRPIEGSALAQQKPIIRVSVIDNKAKIYLALKGPYKIYAVNSDRMVMEGPRLRANVAATKGGIKIGEKELRLDGVKVKVSKDSNIYVDWRRLRGDVDILTKDGPKLLVVNHINLEDYLYGVLYHEVSHRWPIEVLKAQAIVARTFALYQKLQNKFQPYDLRSDIYSQVYGGMASERWATTKAVNLTKNKILVYEGKILPAYYHATCAGSTEDASNLWKTDLPPLKGVECKSCKYSPHYNWTADPALWEVRQKLEENGYKIGDIDSVKIVSKNRSERVDKLEIKDKSGTSVILTGKDFRHMFGPNMIRSTKFDSSIKWNHLILKGLGWGHGVGMCQWGAYGMAKKGRRADEILKFYYPGAEITTIDKVSE